MIRLLNFIILIIILYGCAYNSGKNIKNIENIPAIPTRLIYPNNLNDIIEKETNSNLEQIRITQYSSNDKKIDIITWYKDNLISNGWNFVSSDKDYMEYYYITNANNPGFTIKIYFKDNLNSTKIILQEEASGPFLVEWSKK
ncbi:hypothetical protein [Herpetosiphon geysericola]|uniref:Lipoprotein n=1 Tax=Herpetosiphon geysericola TaxID=70996 RepID=A0A0P6Y978_9CHLR|nr:hypothetical protein [Herpetosiphon geysericola]KPL85684.1 hypothetical protein SE18_15675 [Herpetosiphon geysericola]